jgi:GntR family transcriptional regulator
MDITLNRRAESSVRDQLVAHLHMQILSGALAAGQRLPSVRALARRLRVHANTVSAAYRELQQSGLVERRQGSGVFVRAHAPRAIDEARGLDEMIRMALQAAFRQGYTAAEVRAAVGRWLAASPVDRVLVVDAEAEMAELLVAELSPQVPKKVSWTTIDALRAEPQQAVGALIAAHRYHVGRISRLLPGSPIEPLNILIPREVQDPVRRLPVGSLLVLVSRSPALLPIASALLQSMRGDEVSIEARLRAESRDWKPLVRCAQLVLADMLSFSAVRAVRPRQVLEFRLVAAESIARVCASLGTVAPPLGEMVARKS